MFCFIHRWKIDHALDESAEPDTSTQSHLDDCGACRSYYEEQRELVAQLTRSPVTPKVPASFHANLMNALRAGEGIKEQSGWRLPVWAPIAACAVIAMFVLLPLQEKTESLIPSPLAQPVPAAQQLATLPSIELPEVKITTALERVHDTITAPYTQEFENLQKDLKSAGEYLQGLLGMNLASLQ